MWHAFTALEYIKICCHETSLFFSTKKIIENRKAKCGRASRVKILAGVTTEMIKKTYFEQAMSNHRK